MMGLTKIKNRKFKNGSKNQILKNLKKNLEIKNFKIKDRHLYILEYAFVNKLLKILSS